LESKASALEDPGAELIDRVTGFWARYSKILIGSIAVVAAGAAIGFFAMRARATSENAAAGRLAEASILFWQGDYPRSLEVAKQVYTQYGSTASGLDARRIAGDNAFWTGDFPTAIAEYKSYLDRARSGPLANSVRRSYAYALESGGQSREAAAVYLALVGVFDREASAEFLAAAARCQVAAGQKGEAVKSLQRLLDEYGETTYAVAGRVHLAELAAR
jgi:tetratricopeptide (TPR) repeat protein